MVGLDAHGELHRVGARDEPLVFLAATGAPLFEVVRMASLTPARIAGANEQVGSIDVHKKADLVVTDASLNVKAVYIGGRRFF